MVNLTIAFPDLPRRTRSRIARTSFQNTAMNLLEISRLPDLNPENIKSLVTYDSIYGLNNYEAALAERKGILYLTGHFSAWELLPAAHALHGYPLSFVTRPLDNRFLDSYMQKLRESYGNRVLSKKSAAYSIIKCLRSCGAVGILIDQNTSLREGIFADFFGIPAATTTGLAHLALRTDAPVLPGYLVPTQDGRYIIKFLKPLKTVRTGDITRDLAVNTQMFNKVLEGIIREKPECWLWGHKRWKYQPPGNPQDLYSLPQKELREFLSKYRSGQTDALA